MSIDIDKSGPVVSFLKLFFSKSPKRIPINKVIAKPIIFQHNQEIVEEYLIHSNKLTETPAKSPVMADICPDFLNVIPRIKTPAMGSKKRPDLLLSNR